jgi:hypothetical protein
MIKIQGSRSNVRKPRQSVEALSTHQLLGLHERHFGPLDGKSKLRMLNTARRHGWDRSWEMESLAA